MSSKFSACWLPYFDTCDVQNGFFLSDECQPSSLVVWDAVVAHVMSMSVYR